MKRGQRVTGMGRDGTVLGPEDFEGYERNYPGSRWVLVRWDSGQTTWIGDKWLSMIS